MANDTMYTWWETFCQLADMGVEVASETLRENDATPQKKREQEKFANVKRKARQRLTRSLKAFFSDTPVASFQAGGVRMDDSGGSPRPVFLKGHRVVVRNIESGDTLEITGNEAISMANFLIWFWTCGPASGHLDPKQWVIENLASHGIYEDNFDTHPQSPKDLIDNPWS